MTSTSPTPTIITVTIESVAFGGKGVARLDGKVYFVEDGIAGDVVRVQVTKDSGRYAEGTIVGILTPSPHRGPSPCQWSTSCGGCQWMGVPYEKQLEWKRQFVVTSLSRIGKIDHATPMEIYGSPDALAYRNRIFVRGLVQPGQPVVMGYFRRSTRDLVPITKCAIASPALNAAMSAIESLKFPSTQELRFRMELQEIPEGGDRNIVLTLYPPEKVTPGLDPLLAAIRQLPMVAWAGYLSDLPSAPTLPFEAGVLRYATRPGLFQQVNLQLNQKLREWVHQRVEAAKPARVLDLFCGSGNLSLQLADGRRYVEGIEFSKRAIETALGNVAVNRLFNTNYLSGDTEKHLWKCARAGERFDMVIADPPREGMYGALIPLMKIAPARVIYVSCDPATLARDLASLCKSTYKIIEIAAFDFFPNTYHVETVVLLGLVKP